MDWKVDLNMQRYTGEPTPKRLMGWDGTEQHFWRFSPMSFSFPLSELWPLARLLVL